jgi:hypothetical protein
MYILIARRIKKGREKSYHIILQIDDALRDAFTHIISSFVSLFSVWFAVDTTLELLFHTYECTSAVTTSISDVPFILHQQWHQVSKAITSEVTIKGYTQSTDAVIFRSGKQMK